MLSVSERRKLSIAVNTIREAAVRSTYESRAMEISSLGLPVPSIENVSKEAEVLFFIKQTVNPFIEETYREIKKCANPPCNRIAPRGKTHCSAECFKHQYKR